MGIVSELKGIQTRLWILAGVASALWLVFYFAFPVLITQITYTYFADPALYGVVSNDRFETLFSWAVSMYALTGFPVLWVGIMITFYRLRWVKILFLVFLFITLLWYFVLLIIQFIWINNANDPAWPKNPANSHRACCTPEFYNTIRTCPNFDRPAPECNPPINLNELGIPGEYWFQFSYNLIVIAAWVAYIIMTFQFMRKMSEYESEGGDKTYTQKTLKGADDPGLLIVSTTNANMAAASSSSSNMQVPLLQSSSFPLQSNNANLPPARHVSSSFAKGHPQLLSKK